MDYKHFQWTKRLFSIIVKSDVSFVYIHFYIRQYDVHKYLDETRDDVASPKQVKFWEGGGVKSSSTYRNPV